MIFESLSSRYEKVSFQHQNPKFTKNQKLKNNVFQVKLTLIKPSLERFVIKKHVILLLGFLALQAQSICFGELHSCLYNLPPSAQCLPSQESPYEVVTNKKIYYFITCFASEIKSCQNQNLGFKSFDSHSDKGQRKYLQ